MGYKRPVTHYETPKQGIIPRIGDNDGDVTEEEAQKEEENFGKLSSPTRNRSFLDTQNGIRKDGEQFMIVDSAIFIDTDENFTIKGTASRGT